MTTIESENSKLNLATSWSLYDHKKSTNLDYEGGTRFIGSFKTVPEFWGYFNNLPKPSDLFYQKDIGKPFYDINGSEREIASISLFRKGIKPEWEDPHNKIGGEVTLRKFYKKGIAPVEYLDQLWENLSMGCIGEQFSKAESVTGIRVVDSSVPSHKKPLYRIELWFSNLEYAYKMEEDFKRILNLPENDKIHFKSHVIEN
jgi:translation initiation factor 4E